MKSGTRAYWTLHQRIRRNWTHGPACEMCGATDRRLQWANKDHEYREVQDDWLSLCQPCHAKHDASELCGKGQHPLAGDNLIIGTDGRRRCRACRRASWRKGYREGRWTGGRNGREKAA